MPRFAGRRNALAVAIAAPLVIGLALGGAYVGTAATITALILRAGRVPLEITPAAFGLLYEPIALTTADGLTLRGWLLPATGARAVVMVHGVHANRADPWGVNLRIARALTDRGFTVLMFDLRAHGESDGSRLGLGWDERRDVRAAVDLLLQRGYPAGSIGVFGGSYGAATALLSAAAIPEIGAVVADSAFADIRDLIDNEITLATGLPPIFSPLVSALGRRLYGLDLDIIRPEAAVQAIAPRPILFLHGGADSRIPPSHSERLYRAANNPQNEIWIVPGVEHAALLIVREAEYLQRVTDFFDRRLRPAGTTDTRPAP